MSNPSPTPTAAWASRWLMALAILHVIVAGIKFREPLWDIVLHGVYNGIAGDPVKRGAVWFLLFGPVLGLFSMALAQLEARGDTGALRSIGVGLFLLNILGVVLMPLSGFWLMFPPAIAWALKGDAGRSMQPAA